MKRLPIDSARRQALGSLLLLCLIVPALPAQTDLQLEASLRVVLSPPEAVADGARWRLDGGPSQASGTVLAGLAPGRHRLEVVRPPAWNEPPPSDLVLVGGVLTESTAELAPVPVFFFQAIPPQTARHGKTLRFVATTVDPSSPDNPGPGVRLSVKAEPPPAGRIDFAPETGELSYTPLAGDRTDFVLTFTAPTAGGAVDGQVLVSPLPVLAPEDSTITFADDTVEATSEDYVQIREEVSAEPELFNLQIQNTRKVSVSGADLVFESNSPVMNLHERFHDDDNLKELVILADRVTIRSPLRLPQTRVEIRARELRFEADGAIDVTPKAAENRPDPVVIDDGLRAGRNGAVGAAAPEMVIAVESFFSEPGNSTRFILRGAAGQAAGDGRDGQNVLHPGTRVCETHLGSPVAYVACFNTETDEETVQCGSPDVHSEDAVRSGIPGAGGDGGRLRSTLDLSSLADLDGGASGAKGADHKGGATARVFEKITSRVPPRGCTNPNFNLLQPAPGADRAAPSAQRPAGAAGSFELLPDAGEWLTAIAVKSHLFYLKDLYRAGHTEGARLGLVDHEERLRVLKGDLPEGEEKARFDQLRSEIASLLFRIENNLDYFGNPVTWVPMLSFEANLAAFNAELDRAVPTLYLAHRVARAAEAAESTRVMIEAAKEKLGEEIDAALDEYEAAQEAIPTLSVDLEAVSRKITQVTQRLAALESALLARAQQNVEERHKVPFWKKAVGVLGAIARVIPVAQPALGYIGVGLDVAAGFNPDQPGASLDRLPDLFKAVSGTDYQTCLKGKKEEAKKPGAAKDRGARSARLKACGQLLVSGVKGIRDALKETSAKADEVKAELEKLRAQEPALREMTLELEELNLEKQELGEQIAATLQILTNFSALVEQNLIATDRLDASLDSELEVLDHQAILDVAELGRQTLDRLLKYQYLMAKAYQFRLLRPYTGSLRLARLFEEIRGLIELHGPGEELGLDDFQALKGIYLAELGRIADDILTDYNLNAPERSAPVRYALSREELAELNATGRLELDLSSRNLFGAEEENLRLVSISAERLRVRTVGQLGGVATLRLKYEHDGSSRIRSGGRQFLFTHYKSEGVNPIRWSTVFDGLTNQKTETSISEAAESLIRALVTLGGNSTDDLLLFSRPGALARILVTREVNADNDVSMDLEELILEIQYDYSERSQRNRNLNVQVNEGLLPVIVVSETDLDARGDGRGSFVRSFADRPTVELEAPVTHGVWVFDRWETGSASRGDGAGGAILATSPALTVNLATDVSVRAVYRLGEAPVEGTRLRRGDSNGDGRVNISDPTVTLAFLFTGGSPLGCEDAGDANDDGKLDISDAVHTLSYLFTGTATIPPPGAEACGIDPTTSDPLGCQASGLCP